VQYAKANTSWSEHYKRCVYLVARSFAGILPQESAPAVAFLPLPRYCFVPRVLHGPRIGPVSRRCFTPAPTFGCAPPHAKLGSRPR
jgi:hypothetical protein